ncbi:SDR family oxidoreductase [Candidatus Pacearchaeota archaeon]|nr:SDR family oxidoreductase [Candidatus Pacearchaeota archaeon]
MKLKGKVAVITGGSSGIGKSIAGAFIKNGAKVIVLGINKPDYKCEFYKVDVSKENEIKSAFQKIKQLDILINNAGIFIGGKVENTNTEDLNKVLDVNFKGYFWCSKYSIPKINNGGSIINISSIHGMSPRAGVSVYGATKAAIINLTKALALELAERKIRVNCISPGAIRTPIWGTGEESEKDLQEVGSKYPLKRVGDPEEIAHATVFLAENEFITGVNIPVDGGATI